MGAPVGNQNAAKAKLWSAAIERALDRLATGEKLDPNDDRSPRVKGLDMMADEYVASVRGGGYKAFEGFGDRMEGRPPQALEHSGPDGEPMQSALTVRFGGG